MAAWQCPECETRNHRFLFECSHCEQRAPHSVLGLGLAVLGALLLMASPFAPAIEFQDVRTIDFVQGGEADGTYLVIAALGVLVPGQIGASEGGFALAAEALGTDAARAISIALLSHAVQLALVAVGFLVLVLWPGRKDEPPDEEPVEPATPPTS